MKNGKRLLCTVCVGIVALCLLLSGCSILGKKEEKVRDLTITPVSDSELPQELQTLIKQKTRKQNPPPTQRPTFPFPVYR